MSSSIVVCGEHFDIGTKVVLWDEPKGFNAYDTKPYSIVDEDRQTGKKRIRVLSKGKRYSRRMAIIQPSPQKLKSIVSQLVLHHSGLYRARDTFNVLHNQRGLSVHFILDDDGTLYQTLDLREKAWHGGACNKISVGIEIDSRADARRFPYAYDEAHQRKYGVGSRRIVKDVINGHQYLGYDYSDAQYRTLIRLTRAMVGIFPRIGGTNQMPRFPNSEGGQVIKGTLAQPKKHEGLICHYHISRRKWDPVSMDYERLLNGVARNEPETIPVSATPSPSSLWFWDSIQEALALLGYDPGPIDDKCGPRTRRALKRFQAEHGLVVDGLWGPNTSAAMQKALEERTA